jgi:hypothetical protein
MTPDTPHAIDAAIARLHSSRLQLRQAMGGDRRDARRAREHGAEGQGRPFPRMSALWRCWRRHLRDSPMADAAFSAVQAVWQNHPWRHPGEAAWQQARSVLLPTVHRYPLLTISLVAVGSAALVASKPWRWGRGKHRISARPFSAWLWTQLRLLPIEALLAPFVVMTTASKAKETQTRSPTPQD